MRRKKTKSMLILALLLLGLTVGYAVLSTNLSINGTSTINKPTWDIHFENIVTKSGSVTPTTAAAISNQGKTVTYAVTLNIPGDFYEFNVDVKNAGTIDGMIESITSTVNNQPVSNLPSYVEYYVTYSDGVPIQENQLLTAGNKLTYTVHIGFKRDLNQGDLPSSNQTYNLSFGFTDTQAGPEATSKPYYVYTTSYSIIGTNIVENADNLELYDDYSSLINAGTPFFEKHLINNNVIEESYFGIFHNGKVYYLKPYDNASFDANRTVMEEIIGIENCRYVEGNGAYSCEKDDWGLYALPYGVVTGGNESHGCEFIGEDGYGYSYCH